MRLAGYLFYLFLTSMSLFGADLHYDNSTALNDLNITTQESNITAIHLSDGPTLEEAVTSADLNESLSTFETEDINGTNWFYYRDFLTGMDTAYEYGTSAVIVVGSSIDYSLFWLFSSEEELMAGDANQTAVKKLDGVDVVNLEKCIDCNESVETFIASTVGKSELPKQLASRNPRKGERSYLMSKWFDQETISNGFLDVSNRSYVRLRGGYTYDKLGESEFIYSIAARVKIPRTKEKLDLIIGDDTKNSSDLAQEGTDGERDENSIAIGVNRSAFRDLIKTRYRFGFSGIDNPYGKVDFRYESLLGSWFFEPSQTFKYSYESEFEEWTDLPLRKRISHDAMFTFLMQRSTQSHVKGMNYLVQPSVSIALGEYGNLTPYTGFYGRTKEQPEEEDGYRPKRGVYRYVVGMNWSKQSSARNYIVYRLQPMLYYDDRYDFREDYRITGLLEFYFGLRD